MAVKTNTELQKLANSANADDMRAVYNEVRRYGIIANDKEWNGPFTGLFTGPANLRPSGQQRKITIDYNKIQWVFHLLNGEVMTVKFIKLCA